VREDVVSAPKNNVADSELFGSTTLFWVNKRVFSAPE
jgi:hypothetical protein